MFSLYVVAFFVNIIKAYFETVEFAAANTILVVEGVADGIVDDVADGIPAV